MWETVGGATFDACVKALKPGGRIAVIGMIDAYAGAAWGQKEKGGGSHAQAAVDLPSSLLWKGATAAGFFLLRHAREFGPALAKLDAAARAGTLTVAIDETRFVGVDSVADAVERLHSGRSRGKVVVRVSDSVPPGCGVEAAKL